MRMFKLLFTGLALTLTLPMAAQAYSPDHSLSAKTLQQWQDKVQQYATQAGKPAPQITEYTYGMKLDVAQLVFQSPLDKNCQVVPRLMVFKDSQGELHAVRYQAMSECRSRQ